MILIDCPNCGTRNAQEFRYGGEYNPRPRSPGDTADSDWAGYLYMRDNRAGLQTEWWYHRAGCGGWFLAERDTISSEFVRTYRWQPRESA